MTMIRTVRLIPYVIIIVNYGEEANQEIQT